MPEARGPGHGPQNFADIEKRTEVEKDKSILLVVAPKIFGPSATSAACQCHFYIEEQLQFRLLSQFRPKIGPKPL